MSKMNYEQAKKDHEYLWAIGPAQDMTGAYVDQGDLVTLLASPTKRTAALIYTSQIVYWFQVGPEIKGKTFATYREVDAIARRYDCESELDTLGDMFADATS